MTLDHLGCSKTLFLAVWTPFRTGLRHCLAPEGLQMAHFKTEKGPETCFFKDDPGPFVVLKHASQARFGAVCGHCEAPFGPQTP